MLMSALDAGAAQAWSWASDKPGTISVRALRRAGERRTAGVPCGSTLQNSVYGKLLQLSSIALAFFLGMK